MLRIWFPCTTYILPQHYIYYTWYRHINHWMIYIYISHIQYVKYMHIWFIWYIWYIYIYISYICIHIIKLSHTLYKSSISNISYISIFIIYIYICRIYIYIYKASSSDYSEAFICCAFMDQVWQLICLQLNTWGHINFCWGSVSHSYRRWSLCSLTTDMSSTRWCWSLLASWQCDNWYVTNSKLGHFSSCWGSHAHDLLGSLELNSFSGTAND